MWLIKVHPPFGEQEKSATVAHIAGQLTIVIAFAAVAWFVILYLVAG